MVGSCSGAAASAMDVLDGMETIKIKRRVVLLT